MYTAYLHAWHNTHTYTSNEPSKIQRFRTKFPSTTFWGKIVEGHKIQPDCHHWSSQIHLKTCMTVVKTTLQLADLLENYFLRLPAWSRTQKPTLQLPFASATLFESIQRYEVLKLQASLLHACCVDSASSFTYIVLYVISPNFNL